MFKWTYQTSTWLFFGGVHGGACSPIIPRIVVLVEFRDTPVARLCRHWNAKEGVRLKHWHFFYNKETARKCRLFGSSFASHIGGVFFVFYCLWPNDKEFYCTWKQYIAVWKFQSPIKFYSWMNFLKLHYIFLVKTKNTCLSKLSFLYRMQKQKEYDTNHLLTTHTDAALTVLTRAGQTCI